MILTRIGNKRRIAHKILPLFAHHKMYIEMFFGVGGMFFSKQKAKYNIVNDFDSDGYNLFMVVKNSRNALEAALYNIGQTTRKRNRCKKRFVFFSFPILATWVNLKL